MYCYTIWLYLYGTTLSHNNRENAHSYNRTNLKLEKPLLAPKGLFLIRKQKQQDQQVTNEVDIV